MQIKKGFVTQKIADTIIVVSTGELSKEFHSMIELNYTGLDIWNWISEGYTQEEIAEKLAEKYNIEISKAKQDVSKMIEKMLQAGVLEPE